MQGTAVGWIRKKLDFPNFGERCQAAGVFSTFLILANQAGQSPQKSLRDTKFSLFSFFWKFSILLDVFTRLTQFLFF